MPVLRSVTVCNSSRVPVDHTREVYTAIRDASNGRVHDRLQVREIYSKQHHVFRAQKKEDPVRPVLGVFANQPISSGEKRGRHLSEERTNATFVRNR